MKKINFEITVPSIGFLEKMAGRLAQKQAIKIMKQAEKQPLRKRLAFFLRMQAGSFMVIGIFVVAFAFRGYYGLTHMEAAMIGYFAVALATDMDNRVSSGLALFFLLLAPIAMVANRNAVAEEFAIYAYYFLIIFVVVEIVKSVIFATIGTTIRQLPKENENA